MRCFQSLCLSACSCLDIVPLTVSRNRKQYSYWVRVQPKHLSPQLRVGDWVGSYPPFWESSYFNYHGKVKWTKSSLAHITGWSHTARPCGQASPHTKQKPLFLRCYYFSTLERFTCFPHCGHWKNIRVCFHIVDFSPEKDLMCRLYLPQSLRICFFFAHYILLYQKDLSNLDDPVGPVNTSYLGDSAAFYTPCWGPQPKSCCFVTLCYIFFSLTSAHFCVLLSPSFHIPRTHINEFSYLTSCGDKFKWDITVDYCPFDFNLFLHVTLRC